MKLRLKTAYLIHIFAFLHAAVAFICNSTGMTDELMLTLLTMLMTMMLCIRKHTSIEFTTIAVAVVNMSGYAFGLLFAKLLNLTSIPDIMISPASTFITTECLGFCLKYISSFFSNKENQDNDNRQLVWIVAAVAVVYLTRVLVNQCFNADIFKEIQDTNKLLYFMSSLTALVVIMLIFLFSYAFVARRSANREKKKAGLAQYQYMKLKQQVNPHFLFNSLNILDWMVQESRTEQASLFIHKLAGIYRYMISNEDQAMVKLGDELTFVDMYVDLLKVRFSDGICLSSDIPETAKRLWVVPCSVQLLIENATKHNSISQDKPLFIEINCDGEYLTVTNNRIPKVSSVPSMGLGLKYIKQQYQDLSGLDIEITDNEGESFSVKLPLLSNMNC